jgi:hypothetical protein
MNNKEIAKFLNSIIRGVKFEFRFGCDKTCEGSPALVDKRGIIWLNRSIFKTYKIISQKGLLMHEVGHILYGWHDEEKHYIEELGAQLMAMSIARKNKWKRIYKELENTLTKWSKEFTWNEKHGSYRTYIKASKTFKRMKKKTIQRI